MITDELLSSLSAERIARLFPVGKDVNNERGITSIFLATFSVVKGYSTGVLHSIGKKAGIRTNIECYTEITFTTDESCERPDGLIILRQGKNIVWTALVEAKIGKAELNEDQILRYLHLAKKYNIDAVITISNQFAALPTHHPIKIAKKYTRSVDLFHWSWMFLRTQADYQLRVEDDIDVEREYILTEMIRYFDHNSSGVQTFDCMNKEWRAICLKIKNQESLLKTSDEVQNTVSAWHQEQRDIALKLTSKLKTPVSIKIKKIHKSEPEKRLKDDCALLCEKESLECQFDIPCAASILLIEASLSNRTVICSMEIHAPGNKKTTKARVNWLVRQFTKIETDGIRVGAKWPGGAKITWNSLKELREDPSLIQTDNLKLVPHRFIIQTVVDLAGKFSGQRTFIEILERTVADYYHKVGENLCAWVAPVPKFDKIPNDELMETVE